MYLKKNEHVLKETSEIAALYFDIIVPRYDYLVGNRQPLRSNKTRTLKSPRARENRVNPSSKCKKRTLRPEDEITVDERSDRIILAMGRRRTGDMQVRNAMPRGWGTDNRLIDCTLIDAGPQGTWKEERLQGRLAEEEQPLHAVFDRVPTISLRTNERASDLSRKIYSFIHPKRRLCSLVDPSGFPLSRRSTHTRRAQSRKGPRPSSRSIAVPVRGCLYAV